MTAEDLAACHGVATTAGDVLTALQLRGLVASKQHLAAANRLLGAASAVNLPDCYTVRLCREDSLRLKMPEDRSVHVRVRVYM